MEQQVIKAKTSIFKRWWFWVIVVVVVIAAASNAAKDSEQQASAPTSNTDTRTKSVSPAASSTPTSTAKTEEPAKPKKAVMTKAMFDQLKTGMTLEEVQKIVPGEWEIVSESGTKGGKDLDIHTVMYQFEGKGDLGANATLMFQDEKLVNKAQMGLK
jgi:hypothetical protein